MTDVPAWAMLLPTRLFGQPIDITDDTTNGVPVWVLVVAVIVGPLLGVIGTIVTARVTKRNDDASNEQRMIDQLQEDIRSLRTDLQATRTELSVTQAEMRTLRVRDIAWITYTSDLTRVALEAGATPPPMPTELRVATPTQPTAIVQTTTT